jgi:hypothetical protein
MTWREAAAPIIAETILRVGRYDPTALRKALRVAYPFGDKTGFPYKVWCAEIKRQLGYPLTAPRRPREASGELFALPDGV